MRAFLLGLGIGSLWTSLLWAVWAKGRELRNPDVESLRQYRDRVEALRPPR
jgi:hypothetical protein